MKNNEQPSNLQSIIIELEKKYSYFKKMDIFIAVNNACKKIHPLFQQLTNTELEEIKKLAISDLSL